MTDEFHEIFKEKEALEQEIAVLEKVHSPFIVTYIGATRIPGQPVCLVMQYEKAGSLADVMERKDIQLSERLKCKILLDAAKGVQHMHANDVYHMDLKPGAIIREISEMYLGNMVIASLDESAEVNTKLIDFDLAKFVEDNNYKQDQKGVHYGSIPYCPPETLNQEPLWRAALVLNLYISYCTIVLMTATPLVLSFGK
jgi:serine/threonine protein kinase